MSITKYTLRLALSLLLPGRTDITKNEFILKFMHAVFIAKAVYFGTIRGVHAGLDALRFRHCCVVSCPDLPRQHS
jgi:hypothetical protein